MRSLKFLLLPLLLFAMGASDGARADRGDHRFHRHHRYNVIIAAPMPMFYPWAYPPYRYYSPPPPQVYVEQADAAAGQGGYWYHCDNPSGYYPDVKECPAGWNKLVPTPPY